MSDLLAFLGVLPELIALIKELQAWVHSGGHSPKEFLSEVTLALNELNTSTDPEARTHAAKAISDLISHLPR